MPEASAAELRALLDAELATPVPEAVTAMESRAADIADQRAGELVWLLEHPPLYTSGTSGKQDDLLDILGIGMGRKNEHPRCWSYFPDLPSRLKAIQQRHGDVHYDNVGMKLQRHVVRFTTRLRLAHHLDVAFRLE